MVQVAQESEQTKQRLCEVEDLLFKEAIIKLWAK